MINRNDDSNELKKMVLLCLAAASCVLLVFLALIYSNEAKQQKKTAKVVNKEVDSEPVEEDLEIGKKNLVSEDLDFWEMYDDGYPYKESDEETLEDTSINPKDIADSISKKISDKKKAKEDDINDTNQAADSMNFDDSKADEMDDGKHIRVISETGSANWIDIIEDMPENKYDFKKYLKSNEGDIVYSDEDMPTKAGITISKDQGTIDFEKVKKAGIDFAMIKIGSRGYSKGDISMDEKFVEYANGFKGAGISIGGYFYSMAITDVEAVEEANYAVAACLNYGIKYPIAIEMDVIKNESYRTNKLTNKERTTVVKTFCDTVKDYGFTPVIYADRDYLLSKLNLLDLKDYDFWIKDTAKVSKTASEDNSDEVKISVSGTDYPYKFEMWQYSKEGNINGIDGKVNLNMSFVNYEGR